MKQQEVEVRVRNNPDPRAITYNLYEMYLNEEVVYQQFSYMNKYDVLLQLFRLKIQPDMVTIKPLPAQHVAPASFVSCSHGRYNTALNTEQPQRLVESQRPVQAMPFNNAKLKMPLTHRQRQVLELVADKEKGMLLSDLAKQMEITIEAIKTVIYNLKCKHMVTVEGHGEGVVIITPIGQALVA